jgi:toxin YoeB
MLLRDIERNGYNGIRKPEPLKEDLANWWSVRIDETNRIAFRVEGARHEVLSCKGHYVK